MVDELSPEEKKRLFARLDKVIENHKKGPLENDAKLDSSNEQLDATDDYYFRLKHKEKPKLHNKAKKTSIKASDDLFASLQKHFDGVTFLQSFIYQMVVTVAYLLLSFIIIKFLLINPSVETLNKYISIAWLALIAFDFPLFPVVLSSAWVMARPKKHALTYSLLNGLGYFVWVFVVFLVFGLTKNSLLVYPGYLVVLFVLITAITRGYLGYLLGDWYKSQLTRKTNTKDDYKHI